MLKAYLFTISFIIFHRTQSLNNAKDRPVKPILHSFTSIILDHYKPKLMATVITQQTKGLSEANQLRIVFVVFVFCLTLNFTFFNSNTKADFPKAYTETTKVELES